MGIINTSSKDQCLLNYDQDPIKTLKKSAPASLLLVATLYMLCNIAYFAAGIYALACISFLLSLE